MTHLVQYLTAAAAPALGLAEGDDIVRIDGFDSLAALGAAAIARQTTLAGLAQACRGVQKERYELVFTSGRIRPVDDSRDGSRVFVTGTGLTHMGSAQARDAMHAALGAPDDALSDSMKIFKAGLEGGKPQGGAIGVQPEWFWKGDASILRGSGQPMESPHWAHDFGEEPEIAGIYLVGPDGQPYRLGFALANEMSDHVMERQNYLLLAHSKLRQCALGPQLLTGELPADVQGMSRIYRGGEVAWERPFLSGEDNMTHTIANLEHHHFKYPLFRQPGDLHVHLFGTATISFADGFRLNVGDEMEIHCPRLGRPLRNPVRAARFDAPPMRIL
mgnify:CR=1 FL=1